MKLKLREILKRVDRRYCPECRANGTLAKVFYKGARVSRGFVTHMFFCSNGHEWEKLDEGENDNTKQNSG